MILGFIIVDILRQSMHEGKLTIPYVTFKLTQTHYPIFIKTTHDCRWCKFTHISYFSYDRRNILEVATSGHVTCNVWGWICQHGMGDVFRIEGRFTANKYIEILEECFLPSLRERDYPFPQGPILFIHDKCPIHTANVVRRWFQRQDNFELLDWPSKGADMNVIENVWAQMVNTWEMENERDPNALWAHVQRQWEYHRRRPQMVQTLVASMPRRLQKVIDNGGGWTGY